MEGCGDWENCPMTGEGNWSTYLLKEEKVSGQRIWQARSCFRDKRTFLPLVSGKIRELWHWQISKQMSAGWSEATAARRLNVPLSLQFFQARYNSSPKPRKILSGWGKPKGWSPGWLEVDYLPCEERLYLKI